MRRNAVAWVALVVSTAALVSSRGVTRLLPAAPKITGESQRTAKSLSEAFNAVAEFSKPSVVQISVERKPGSLNIGRGRAPFPGMPNGPQGIEPKDFEELLRRFFGPDVRPEKEQFGRRVEGIGSGFVYDEKGHIVTNNHVVENSRRITVKFYDGVETTATVVGTDPQSDIAVIKVENTHYRPLPRGQSSNLKVGELVMAVGSPYNLDQSVTTGIVSATDRNSVGINEFESFIQTDAAINPGNSGGPLLDMNGEVIGVNSAIVVGGGGRGNDGVGFAIPIDMASKVADNLIKSGKVRRSRVGIALEPLAPVMARKLGLDPKIKGVVIGDVVKGSPADKAGLKPGDVITGFNGSPVVSLPSFRLTVAASEAGQEFSLTYWRDGKERRSTIVPAPYDQVHFAQEQNRPNAQAEGGSESAKAEISDFGLEVQPVTPELAAQFGHPKDSKGLLISDVKEGSPAEQAGLAPGQLITRVVKDKKVQAVNSVKEFQDLAKSNDIALYVELPNGQGHFITLSRSKKD
jgi:serine protease Do